MTEETLKLYGPCQKHHLYFDLKEGQCFYCLCERSVTPERPAPKPAEKPAKPAAEPHMFFV